MLIVDVVFFSDGFVSVMDDGCGIFIDLYFVIKKLVLEIVLMIFYVGGKFGGESSGYIVFGGFYGVGIFVVNVLFESLEVIVWWNGMEYK